MICAALNECAVKRLLILLELLRGARSFLRGTDGEKKDGYETQRTGRVSG